MLTERNSSEENRTTAECWLKAGILVALASWIYFPALNGSWIWDDQLEIVRNAELRGAFPWSAWIRPAYSDYLPLKTTLQWIEWQSWGDWPLPYHVVSVLTHLLNAGLAWKLLRELGMRMAWVAALVFAIHPLAVESVAWIAEQKNTFSLLLLLLAADAFLAFERRGQWRFYGASVALFVGAMLCKSSVVMFPCALILFSWWRDARVKKKDVFTALPFFAVSLALGILTIFFQSQRAIGAETVPLGSWLARLDRAVTAAGFYAVKSIWPVHLLPVYPRTDAVVILASRVASGVLVAVGIWAGTRLDRGGRTVLVACGFFIVNLVPVLGLVPMAFHRIAWVSDHFAYISLLAASALVPALIGVLGQAVRGSRRSMEWGFLLVVAGFYVWTARTHAAHFSSEEVLWRYTLERNPDAWIAHNNLGQILASRGDLQAATLHFERAMELRPSDADAAFNLGNILVALERFPEAVPFYERAVKSKPGSAEIENNLGSALLRSGRSSEAIIHLESSVALAPQTGAARANLGRALKSAGKLEDAVQQLQMALTLEPGSADVAGELANGLADLGRGSEAIKFYRVAISAKPNDAELHNNLGSVFAESGELTAAVNEFRTATELDANYRTAKENLVSAEKELADANRTKK